MSRHMHENGVIKYNLKISL